MDVAICEIVWLRWLLADKLFVIEGFRASLEQTKWQRKRQTI